MTSVKYAMMAVGLLGAALSLLYGVLSYGVHGAVVLVACLVPAALGGLGTLVLSGLPRWAAVVSAVSFLVVAVKTSSGADGSDVENIMMVGALGLVLAVALAIRPERPRA